MFTYLIFSGDTCYSLASNKTCVTLSGSRATWESSVGSCLRTIGHSPSIVGDEDTQQVLVEVMRKYELHHLWLPARMDRNSWIWIGDEEKCKKLRCFDRKGYEFNVDTSSSK